MPDTNLPNKRIVSLTPSITETLFALGLGHRVVGVTDSCDYPEEAGQKQDVSCWFDPDMEKLTALEPDLVLGLKTAHLRLKPVLERKGIRVILMNPATVDEALNAISELGDGLGVAEDAKRLVKNLRHRLTEVDDRVGRIPLEKRYSVSRILDWESSEFLVAGPLSFQFDVISRAGGRNVTGRFKEAYPRVSLAQLRKLDPEVIFFCGYDRNFIPRLVNDPKWRSFQAVHSGRVYQFDCALTCRTGPRIVDMTELLFKTLYGDQGSV